MMASAGALYTDPDCPIDLGFLEECEPWLLQSRFFRSKFGGRPSWLDLENLPPMSEMKCSGGCDNPLTFLCQVYAPVDTKPDAFHRTIFIFLCKSPKCLQFKALRCQLSRDNRFYPSEAPMESPDWKPELTADSFARLCRGCGCGVDGPGGKCGGCKKVNYCHRLCQVTDWKKRHKHECKLEEFDPKKEKGVTSHLGFPEFEIVMAGDDGPEVSDEGSDEDEDGEDEVESSEMENFRQLEREGKTGQLTQEDLAQFDVKEDAELKKFRKAIRSAPDQVVRYARGKRRPLWVSNENTPEEIPACQLCSGERVFEFQIMPQALNHMGLEEGIDSESLDWGTLAIYTCKESCQPTDSPAYKTEFVWRQPMS